MPVTIREYLGDEKIAQLEGMGFLPNLIADMAKRQYMQDRQDKRNELADSGLDGKLVQGIMRGNINEEEARNAQKFEDFGAKKHGWGLGAAKTVAGIANAAERVSDFVNPFYEGKRDERGNYIYQNAIEKGLRPKIKSAEKLRDDYEKATGETSWGSRAAEIGTEMVADPINFVGGLGLLSKGSKLAQFGKKTLYFAGTGAASGGIMALGEGRNDEETLKNMGYGAVGGFVLGHAIDQGVQGIGKLIAKRRASRAANEADAVSEAENSEFLRVTDELGDSEIRAAEMMTAREFATGEAGLDEATAAKVIKEAARGKEKSDFVDANTYADIVNFKNFESQRDYARAYGEQIEAAKQSLNNAREQSAVRYADTQKAINEYQKQGMSASATRELINAKFKPGADEINYTRAYNGGADVDPRLAGQGIFYALEKDIATQAYTPEIYATRLKQRGFGDESTQVFTQAYVQKDINIAKDWANAKVAEAYEGQIQKQIAEEIRARDEAETNGLSDSVSSIGDNASRASGRQGSDEQILRQGRWDTSNAGETKQRAQSDRQMEQRLAAKTDGETDAAATGEQVVEKQREDASIGGGVAANSNAHLGSGLVAGTLNSVDEDGNFSPERFAAGFLAGLAGSKAVAAGLRKMTPRLYNQILGAAEKMPQMANGNPRLLGKLYSNGKDVSLNSFAGEKAITANVGKLDQAKALLEKGADEVEIWQKTGWFKDEIDDKWKFEINPRGGELKPNPPRNTVLYNVLNDEKLYEAYPELQLYKVEIAGEYNPAALKALGSADGGFIPSQKTFIINEKTTDFKSTLYHEIQHAIQEIEGFSPGASSKNGKYWLAGGEVEARNVQKRMNDVSYDGFKNSTSMEFFPYKEEAQLQRMAGDKEYMEYHKLSKKYSDYLSDKGDELGAQEEARFAELYEKIKDRLGFAEDDYKKGYELYLKENAEYQKHPLHTLDAPRGERVNMGRGDLNLSKELEKKYILKDGSINEAAVRKEAEPFIEKEYNLENFKAEFPNGKVDTPIGEVNISSFQLKKLELKGREKYLGLIKPTLERPAFVVDFEDTTFFFKPFRDKDGVVKFASVIKERDGGLDVTSNYPMANRKFELIAREGKVRYVQGSVAKPVEHSLDDTVRSSGDIKSLEHSSDGKGIIQQNEEKVYHSRKIEEIKREHPNVEKELDESIAAMRKESFNDSNFKDGLISKFDTKEITTQELGKSVNLSDKQLAVLKNDIKNADFKVINESKIYFDKIGKDGDKKRFFVDIAEDGSLRVDAYAKSKIDSIPIKQSALEELADAGDSARLKNMSFEVKAAYRNELDPIKKEAILKTAELNKLKKAAQGGDKAAVAKFEEFKAKNLDEDGNIKDGLELC